MDEKWCGSKGVGVGRRAHSRGRRSHLGARSCDKHKENARL